jgi:hypothetical protein
VRHEVGWDCILGDSEGLPEENSAKDTTAPYRMPWSFCGTVDVFALLRRWGERLGPAQKGVGVGHFEGVMAVYLVFLRRNITFEWQREVTPIKKETSMEC